MIEETCNIDKHFLCVSVPLKLMTPLSENFWQHFHEARMHFLKIAKLSRAAENSSRHGLNINYHKTRTIWERGLWNLIRPHFLQVSQCPNQDWLWPIGPFLTKKMGLMLLTILSCQSSSLPTYMGLSVSLMVSFPDNLKLPYIRSDNLQLPCVQPPTSLHK